MDNTSNNKISNLINSQVPFFVRNDHPAFVDFLEAYYEYLEQSGKTIERANGLLSYRDIDNTLDEFSEKLYQTFMASLPKEPMASKDIIIKNVKDFYRSRGSEKSLKFLLRIMFDKEATIYYPKQDILRASDGKWYIQKSLRVENTVINLVANSSLSGLEQFVSRRIRGNTTNTTATVERVDRFYELGTLIDELILSNIDGEFQNGELVYTSFVNDLGETVRANTYINSGYIKQLILNNGGTGYSVNDPLTFESDSGSGATAYVSEVSSGNVSGIFINYSGAGFLANDWITITGGGGTGANARVTTVSANDQFHPSTYTLYTTRIADLAGQTIGAEPYANLNTSIISSPNANSNLMSTLQTFSYGPTGPVETITLYSAGNNYISKPTLTIASNTLIQSFGILGRMNINDGGRDYAVGEIIEFIGGSGTGALANVKAIDVNGAITQTEFLSIDGFYKGGVGYSQSQLPSVNIATVAGTGANITVSSIIGDGEVLTANLTNAGQIFSVTLASPGSGFITTPTVNMRSYGDGTANIEAQIIQGVYTYPGRYLNDDGHLSSTNYLQNRDYYQNFSYVVIVEESLDKYKKMLLDLVHPAGTKLFAVYEKKINV